MNKLFIFVTILVLFVELYVCEKKSYRSDGSCGKKETILFKENEESHRMIEIVFLNNTINECFIYGDKQLAQKKISEKLCQPKVIYVDTKFLSEWALKCSDWLLNQIKRGGIQKYTDEDFPDEYNNGIDRNFFEGIMIYPGTKWCGAGDIAEHYEDLGKEEETDKCCREHDLCFDQIFKGETKYGLKNTAIHTKTHCECDHEFKECLSSINKGVPQTIAKLFFNLIQIQCFKKDFPIVECLEYKGIPFFWKSCQKYSFDFTKPMIYQFFDAIFID